MKKILFLIMALIASSPLATAKDKTVELCILGNYSAPLWA